MKGFVFKFVALLVMVIILIVVGFSILSSTKEAFQAMQGQITFGYSFEAPYIFNEKSLYNATPENYTTVNKEYFNGSATSKFCSDFRKALISSATTGSPVLVSEGTYPYGVPINFEVSENWIKNQIDYCNLKEFNELYTERGDVETKVCTYSDNMFGNDIKDRIHKRDDYNRFFEGGLSADKGSDDQNPFTPFEPLIHGCYIPPNFQELLDNIEKCEKYDLCDSLGNVLNDTIKNSDDITGGLIYNDPSVYWYPYYANIDGGYFSNLNGRIKIIVSNVKPSENFARTCQFNLYICTIPSIGADENDEYMRLFRLFKEIPEKELSCPRYNDPILYPNKDDSSNYGHWWHGSTDLDIDSFTNGKPKYYPEDDYTGYYCGIDPEQKLDDLKGLKEERCPGKSSEDPRGKNINFYLCSDRNLPASASVLTKAGKLRLGVADSTEYEDLQGNVDPSDADNPFCCPAPFTAIDYGYDDSGIFYSDNEESDRTCYESQYGPYRCDQYPDIYEMNFEKGIDYKTASNIIMSGFWEWSRANYNNGDLIKKFPYPLNDSDYIYLNMRAWGVSVGSPNEIASYPNTEDGSFSYHSVSVSTSDCMDSGKELIFKYLPKEPRIILDNKFGNAGKIKIRIIMHYRHVYLDVAGKSAIEVTPVVTLCGV